MKNLQPIFKILMLLLVLTFAACKKDGAVKPGPDIKKEPVTTNDLLAYNIMVAIKNPNSTLLRAVSFNKDGAEIKATWDGAGTRRIVPVSIVNNTLKIDINGTGKIIYTFVFDKDNSGKIKLASYSYFNQDDASYFIGADIQKRSDAIKIANRIFATPTSELFVKFSDAHKWTLSFNSDFGGAVWADYYDVSPGIWKGTYNGAEYIGITYSEISDGKISERMYLQKAGENNYSNLTAVF